MRRCARRCSRRSVAGRESHHHACGADSRRARGEPSSSSEEHGKPPRVRCMRVSQSLPFDDPILMESEKIRLCCQAGTLLAHDALMMHSADKNQSNLPRRSLGFIYYGSSVEINEKEGSEYQKKLDDELIKKGLV